MNTVSWLLLILIALAFMGVVVFKFKNRSAGGCGGACSGCASAGQKDGSCSSAKEHIIHIQKMGR